MNINIRRFSFLAIGALFLAGCVRGDSPGPRQVDPDPKVFIMYDNIERGWFARDVAEAGMAVASDMLKVGQRVVVFQKISSGNEIYELVPDSKSVEGFSKKVLKKYKSGEMDLLNRETIAEVVGFIRDNIEANHYGFAFGSHGMGWVPKDYNGGYMRRIAMEVSGEEDPFAPLWYDREGFTTRFLSGYGQKIDVSEFADALDEWKWDFILFDDCFMASIEAQYEMRHLAEYFIASPTEIMGDGFAYDDVVKRLFTDWDDLEGVAKGFVDFYRIRGSYATISVVKTSEIEDLAASVRDIVNSELWMDVDPSQTPIQSYEEYLRHIFYDLDDFLRNGISPESEQYRAFVTQMAETVVFSGHTDNFYSHLISSNGTVLPITHFSGLNVFIPWSGTAPLMPYYEETEWYKAVYAD